MAPHSSWIFVVSDDAAAAADLSRRLSRVGHRPCGTARPGKDAIRTISEADPDVVLLDIAPEAVPHGAAFARELGAATDVGTVILLPPGSSPGPAPTPGRGVFLLKPVDDRDLRTAIERAVTGLSSSTAEAPSAPGAADGPLAAVVPGCPVQKGESLHACGGEDLGLSPVAGLMRLLDVAPDAILAVDADGRIAAANRRTEEMFGWSLAELRGQPVEVLIPPEYRDGHRELRAAYMLSGQPRMMGAHEGGMFGYRRDGGRFPVEVGLVNGRMEDGACAIAVIRDITEREHAREALSAARSLLDDALESINEGVILWDADDRVAVANRRARELHPAFGGILSPGRLHEELLEAALALGIVEVPDGVSPEVFVGTGSEWHARADGAERHLHLSDGSAWSVTTRPSRGGGRVTVLTDQTERASVEERFRRAQKMEALGKLTGGLAHDFNNCLGVIFGYLELLRDEVHTASAREYVEAALKGAARGSQLTRSLLAFARRQPLRPRITDVGRSVTETVGLIRRTLGEDVEVILDVGPDLHPVHIDEEQLASTIVNLANNARDAMPRGGRLTLSVRNVDLDMEYERLHPYACTGPHVLLQVSDSGNGMSAETRSRVFEPFFTTKGPGEGTGLGLSMVYGFVKQSGGHIDIYSEVGMGTSVKIFVPRAEGAGLETIRAQPAPAIAPPGHETVLVVEDNEDVRRSVVLQVRSLGYRVLEADNGEVALRILEGGEEDIDLLFTDVVMPGAPNGVTLSRRARQLRPGLATLLTSGFPGEAFRTDLELDAGEALLSKPYRKLDLARALRVALDESHGPGAPTIGADRS